MSSNNTRQFLAGISVQTVITLVMGVGEIVVFALFSRLLTKSDFGYYAALCGIVAICQSISEAGLGSALIQKKNADDSFYYTSFTLSAIIGLCFSVVLCLFAPFFANLVADETLVLPLRLVSVTVFFNGLINVGNAYLYRGLKFIRIGVIQCFSYFASAFIGLFMAVKGYGLFAVVLYTILYSLFNFLLLFFTSVPRPSLKIYKTHTNSIINYGGWLTLGSLANNITLQLDKLCLSKWLSVEALGTYNRPTGFVSTITSKINSIFDTVLFPLLSGLQDDYDTIKRTFYKAIILLNSFSIVLACFFFFNAELIIALFFGKEWGDTVPVMRVVAIGVMFTLDNRLADCFFRSLNLVKISFFVRLLGGIITLLGLFFGSKFGIIGVAIGVVLANIILIMIKLIIICKNIKAEPREMYRSMVISWKPAILLVVCGVLFLSFFNLGVIHRVLFLVVFCVIVLLEFLFIPSMVNEEYASSLFPEIKSFIKGKFNNGSYGA